MHFVCPDCGKRGLEIRIALRLPPDDFSDERALQLLRCALCGEDALAFYECSRRGSDERWHHLGYRVAKSTIRRLWKDAEHCLDRDDPRCGCAAHRWPTREALGRDTFAMTER